MPKSKRARGVSLSVVKPKTRSSKEKLLSSIQESVNAFQFVFLFRVDNMRNQSMKEVRDLWQGSRFFMGKTSVMRRALETVGDEQRQRSLQQLCQHFAGEVGLFFTDSDVKKVMDWFGTYRVPNYAKAGFTSDREFKLPEGPLPQDVAPFSIEPQLRKLGLPTRLRNGVVELTLPVTVCRAGDRLTPEQCRILQMFDEKFAYFQFKVIGMWNANDGFKSFESDDERKRALAARGTAKNDSNAHELMTVDEDDENHMNEDFDAKIDHIFVGSPAPAVRSKSSAAHSSSSSSSSSSSATPASTRQLRSHTKAAASASGSALSSSSSSSSSFSSSFTPYAAAVAARNSARKIRAAKSKKQKRAESADEADDMDDQ